MKTLNKGAQRTCIACRTTLDKSDLIRYVVAPNGNLLVDYRQKLPGRGAYTCPSIECIEKAAVKNGFTRCFRGRCQSISKEDIVKQLGNSILSKIESLLGMARKAGMVTSGSNMVMDQLRKPQCDFGLVLTAQDISPDIGRKIEAITARVNIPHSIVFKKDKIGHILGKEERSVVGILSGTLADTMLTELSRYRLLAREN